MYNSSIKEQGEKMTFEKHTEIPHRVFFNDMSKNYMCDEFKDCDVVYSEIAWPYGYPKFNERAGNTPNKYTEYLHNIHKLIHELNKPAFIICGKPAKKVFDDAKMQPIKINTSRTNMNGCQLYFWNYNDDIKFDNTEDLLNYLSKKYKKCLDFSCGYGQHLFKFNDFIACDIDNDCLTYISILLRKKENKLNGKTEN